MSDKQWFLIKDLNDFVDHFRSLVFKFFGTTNEISNTDSLNSILSEMSKEEIEEMNETLSHAEAEIIIKNYAKKQVNKKTKEIRYCINDKIFQSIIEDLNTRMISNILNTLVNKGVLDSAFDTDQNDFIFWIKDEDDNKNPKSETD